MLNDRWQQGSTAHPPRSAEVPWSSRTSTVPTNNIPKTCRYCHKGPGQRKDFGVKVHRWHSKKLGETGGKCIYLYIYISLSLSIHLSQYIYICIHVIMYVYCNIYMCAKFCAYKRICWLCRDLQYLYHRDILRERWGFTAKMMSLMELDHVGPV